MKAVNLIVIFTALTCCGETGSRKTLETGTDQVPSEARRDSAAVSSHEPFEEFYRRFYEDSIFQMERIQFPLEGERARNFEVERWSKETWEPLKVRGDHVDTTEFKVDIRKERGRVTTRVYIPDSDVQIRSVFAIQDGKWYLIKHDDWF